MQQNESWPPTRRIDDRWHVNLRWMQTISLSSLARNSCFRLHSRQKKSELQATVYNCVRSSSIIHWTGNVCTQLSFSLGFRVISSLKCAFIINSGRSRWSSRIEKIGTIQNRQKKRSDHTRSSALATLSLSSLVGLKYAVYTGHLTFHISGSFCLCFHHHDCLLAFTNAPHYSLALRELCFCGFPHLNKNV